MSLTYRQISDSQADLSHPQMGGLGRQAYPLSLMRMAASVQDEPLRNIPENLKDLDLSQRVGKIERHSKKTAKPVRVFS
jgi:hypothetical protein